MTNQEAIAELKSKVDVLERAIEHPNIEHYRMSVECYKLAIAALKKQEPQESPCKEPTLVKAFDGTDRVLTYKCISCPSCGKWISIHGAQKSYCEFCGQAVKLTEDD